MAAPVATSTAAATSVPAPNRRAIARNPERSIRAGTTAAASTSCPPRKNAIATTWRNRIACHTLLRSEALDERKGRVGDVLPAVVDRQRVPAPRDRHDLGDVLVLVLEPVGRVDDRRRDRVVAL